MCISFAVPRHTVEEPAHATDRKLHVENPTFVALVFNRLSLKARASAHRAALTSVIVVD
jgi:hypothetical protein